MACGSMKNTPAKYITPDIQYNKAKVKKPEHGLKPVLQSAG
jgi:hypothetical protein